MTVPSGQLPAEHEPVQSEPAEDTGGRRRRRRGGRSQGNELTTIWWRDIPTQVIGRPSDGGEPVRAELPRPFLMAVDRAAMEVGLAGTDAYLQQWVRRARPCGDDVAAEVAAEVERLVADHPRPVLSALVANGAYSPEKPREMPVDATPSPTDPDDPAGAP